MLNPCPFCGGNVTYTQNDITGEHHIKCLECAVLVLFNIDLLKENVIAHWNTRTPIPNPQPRREDRQCNDCHQIWMNAGHPRLRCPFCFSLNTHIVEGKQ